MPGESTFKYLIATWYDFHTGYATHLQIKFGDLQTIQAHLAFEEGDGVPVINGASHTNEFGAP